MTRRGRLARNGPGLLGVGAGVAVLVLALGASFDTGGARFGLQVRTDAMQPGLTLYGPLNTHDTYLIDEAGQVVHRWANTGKPGNSAYLLPDGQLLRAEKSREPYFLSGRGRGGVIEEVDPDGSVRWRFTYAGPDHLQHHDIEPMPNGNVLALAWERHTLDEAIARGRAPELLAESSFWSETIVEIDRATSQIVWTWRIWDHLVQDRDPAKPNFGAVATNPGRLDLNFPGGSRKDWLHANSVAYNADLDQIVVSVRRTSEVWIIDHSITTEEASGPAGDLLFRWGNPAVFGHGVAGDQTLFGQHDAQWIPAGRPGAGSLLVFNNGSATTRPYSSVDEIRPVRRNGTYARDADGGWRAHQTRVHPTEPDQRWLSGAISGAQRLENGNTLVVDGPAGRLFEVAADQEVVWEYVNPFHDGAAPLGRSRRGEEVIPWRVFNARRYARDHPGVQQLLARR